MPRSPLSKTETAPAGGDERLWKRQLEQARLTQAASDKPAAAGTEDAGDPQRWRRQLEHGRLSAMAMPQGTAYAGPGAAAAAVTGGMPSPAEITGLVKDAQMLLKLQDRKGWPMKISQIPWIGWLLSPIGLAGVAGMKFGHDAQQAGAARRLTAASKKYPIDKLPIPYVKAVLFAIKHWSQVQIVEWLAIIGTEGIVFILFVMVISMVILLQKCFASGILSSLDCLTS
jgi:hypothetical protein